MHVRIALSGPLVSCCQQICHSGNASPVWLRERNTRMRCVCVGGWRRSAFRGIESFPGCVCTSDVSVGLTRVTLPLSGMTQVLLCSSPCCGLLIRSDSKRNPSGLAWPGLASVGSGGRSEMPARYQPPHKPLYTSRGKILGFRL